MDAMNEEVVALIESTKYKSLSNSDANAMKLMLENTSKEHAKMIAEGTVSGDIAQFTPILMPLVRRVYPNLIANELLGVQPMIMPTGFIYSLTNGYIGDGGDLSTAGVQTDGSVGSSTSSVILDITVTGTDAGFAVGSVITGNVSGATGIVTYIEGTKYLVAVTSGAFLTTDGAATTTKEDGTTASTDTGDVTAVYTNEAAFKNIFKSYTGPVTTAVGELLGKNMKEIGFRIVGKTVEAKTRKLKGQYTLEMYQDLKAQHGLLADEEIMSLMSYEMQGEIDREVVDFVNANATNVPNASDISFSGSSDAAGRWEIEKYRTEVIKISKESKQIGIDTKRGTGNVLVVSPKVVTMLEQVGSFKPAEQASGVTNPISGGVAGTFDGKYKVVVDQYAASDYATVLYKGADRRDAMGFFAPYVPLSFQKVTHEDSGQPAIIASTRYGLDTTPVNPEAYARTFGIDYTNSALA